MTKRTLLSAGMVLGLLVMAAPAGAQTSTGVRAGVSGDPDQFVFGGHIETGELMERVTFRPSVEVGVGNGWTGIGLNFEFAYWIPLDNQDWRLYLGGGPALNIWSRDRPERSSETEVGGGFNIMIGVQHARGLLFEFKVGAIDSPDVKFVIGYVFEP
jgi:hypothetical protein